MEWDRGAKIGQGSFGVVNLAKPRSYNNYFDDSQLWAVKSCSASCSVSLLNEKRILDELKDCPEVIQCYGDCYTYENNEKSYNLFLEYASEGSLYRKIKKCQLSENEVRRYSKGIVSGLNYIHRNGFVHCDIKLQNILLNQDQRIKIADFGLAKRTGDGNLGCDCEIRGTPMYMSPEMVTGGDQGSAADIWALGCLVAEMFTGASVWKCTNVPELLLRIGGGGAEMPEIPKEISDEGKDFLRNCFIKDPERRWTAEMLLSHPFLTYDFDDHCSEFPSTSPRCAFDFPEWVPQRISPTSSSLSSSERLQNSNSNSNSNSSFNGELNSCYGSNSDLLKQRLQSLIDNNEYYEWPMYEEWINVR